MKAAFLALAISATLLGVLLLASLFGYPLDFRSDSRATSTTATQQTSPVQASGGGKQPEAIEVPSGTFKGPTAQPTMRGPSGPPPQQ